MAAAAWFGGYLLALLLEVAVLPQLFGAAVPAVARALLLIGIAEQSRSPAAGLAFAVLSGLARDLLAPPGAGIHVLVNCLTFLAMHLAMGLAPWEEPIRRIAAVLSGLAAGPLSRLIVAAGGAAWGLAVPLPSFFGIARAVGWGEGIATAAWVVAYAGASIIRFRRLRSRTLLRIR